MEKNMKKNRYMCLYIDESHPLAISHASISHTSKVMLKILQARLQQHVNFQMFKLNLEKAEEPQIKLPTSIGHRKSKRVPEKHLLLLY